MKYPSPRTPLLLAEAIGTMLLVAVVVGSGVMAQKLSGGNTALALLGNTLATAAALFALILMFAPVSGAHFNPAVSLAAWASGKESGALFLQRMAVQAVGGIAGTLLAHAMFDLPLIQHGIQARTGMGQWISEVIAASGLILVVSSGVGRHALGAPLAVAAWITAGYWFTQSTCFANPAVALARGFTETFAGIRMADVPGFVLAEITGALLGWRLAILLFHKKEDHAPSA